MLAFGNRLGQHKKHLPVASRQPFPHASKGRPAMSDHELLFPRRQTRRAFLQLAGTAAVAGVVGKPAIASESTPVKFGSGRFTYTLDEGWGKLPAGMKYGF